MTSSLRAPERCPLCGQPNQCAMEVERATGARQPPCWCTRATFTEELLQQVPADARGHACICAACAQSLSLRTS
ncbi:MAG TPA: cysteine-rich CWC family protein [Ramlibacter sp.]|nr:cysteine-rich CWC family protein [Ramlibacter sp.]